MKLLKPSWVHHDGKFFFFHVKMKKLQHRQTHARDTIKHEALICIHLIKLSQPRLLKKLVDKRKHFRFQVCVF